jgi:nucleoside-diphosphate-sugar epimerase
MIVDGGGLLASAFVRHGSPDLPVLVFARGVSDSATTDEAAYDRERAELVEALGRAAAQRVTFVHFAGAPIYGDFDKAVTEGAALLPRTRYGRHQVECESIVRDSGVRFLLLRLPNAVGPGGNPSQLVPSLVRQARAGRVRIRDGAARDLIDVEDVVTLTERLVGAGVAGTVVNVASGVSVTAEAIVSEIATILGAAVIVDRVPGGDAQRFSIERLLAWAGPLAFDDEYPLRVLRRYVPIIAGRMAIPSRESPPPLPSAGDPPAAS